jgi:hypothetical protein
MRWQHPSVDEVRQLFFIPGRGLLLSLCGDNSLHLWNLGGPHPVLEQSLLLNHERISMCKLPAGSDWILVGTDKGNVYFVRAHDLSMSSAIIYWNYTAPPGLKEAPGHIVVLEPCPIEPAKLLIGYSYGRVVLYDTKEKTVEKFYATKQLPVSVTVLTTPCYSPQRWDNRQ